MNESHGLQFNVDTSGIAGGLAAYKSAVDGIFSSLDRFERTATKTFDSVNKAAANKSNLSTYAKSMQGLGKIDIDATAARKIKGLSDAVSGFKAPTERQSASLKAFFKSLTGLPDLSAATASVRTVAKLSASLENFKAPSPGAAKNMRAFFKALEGLPDISGAARSIQNVAGLGASLSGFKAPSAASAANLLEFAKASSKAMPLFEQMAAMPNLGGAVANLNNLSSALKALKAPSTGQVTNLGNLGLVLRNYSSANINGLSRIGTAISGISNFKAPTKAQIRNLDEFVKVIDNMRVPQNAGAIASAINQITSAAGRANRELGGLRGGLGGLNGGLRRTGREAHQASLNMMGLQNAFSGTFQAGSVLRSLFGALTLGQLGRNFFEASNAAMSFNAQMAVMSKDAAFADAQLDYINHTARAFGMDMLTAEKGFAKISIAANKTGLSVKNTRGIFEGFSSEMAVLGTSTERQNDVWLAVQQVMNKGYLSAEELQQQLNEQLPGAMAYATEYANSLGMSLQDALAKKAMKASDVLQYMSKRMKEDFGPAVAKSLERPAAQMTILQSNIDSLFQEIGKQGGNKAFARMLMQFNDVLDPEKVQGFAQAVGEGLVKAVDKASQAFQWLRDNWDSIKGPLGTSLKLLGEWMVVSAALNITQHIVSPLVNATTTMIGFSGKLRTVIKDLAAFQAVMATSSAMGPATALAQMSPAAQKATAAFNGLRLMLAGGGTGAAGSVMGAIGTVGAGAATMLGGLLVAGAGIGAAFMSGAKAARDSGIQLQADQYTTAEIVKGMWLAATGKIGEWWNTATTAIASLWTEYLGPAVSDVLGFIAKLASETALGLTYGFTTAVNIIKNLFAALAKSVANTFTLMSSGAKNLLSGNFAGALQDGLKLATGDGIKAGFRDAFRDGIKSYGQFKKEVGAGYAVIDAQFAAFGAQGRAASVRQPAAPKKPWQPKPYQEPATTSPDNPASASKSKGKSPAEKAQDAFEAFASSFNSFMSGLDSNDKVGKILDQWSSTLTGGAKALLSPGGYADAMATVRDYSDGAESAAQGLIKALTSGKLNQTALASLKKMGITPEEIVQDLKDAIEQQDEKISEALVKAATKRYKAMDKALGKLAEFNPEIKISTDFSSNLLDEAQGMLTSKGLTQFLPVYQQLRDGAISADAATQKLIDLLNSPEAAQSGLTALLPQITAMLGQQNVAREQAANLAKLQAQFGYDVLKGMQDEADQLRMSSKQQDTFAKLQDAVNAAKQRGAEVTQTMVDALRKQIDAQRELNDTIAKTNELHDKNGIRQWASQTMQAADWVNKLDNDLQSGLEDTLYRLGTEGKLSFKSLMDTIQGDLIRMASQSLTKDFTNAVLGPLFNKDGSMNGKDKSWFNGLFGRKVDPTTYKSQDEWASMSSAVSNPDFKPTYDASTGLITAFGDKMIPQQTQAFTTSLTNTFTFGADRALRVLVTNPPTQGTGATAGTDPLGGLGSLVGLGNTGLDTSSAGMFSGADFSSFSQPMDFSGFSTSAASGLDLSGIETLNNSISGLAGSASSAATGLTSAGTAATDAGGIFSKLFGGGAGGAGTALAGFAGGGIGSAISGKKQGGTSQMLSMLAQFLPPPWNMIASGGMGLLGGLFGFREGGISGSSVGAPFSSGLYGSKFSSAPHFAEGTHNTGSFAGGMPAVLHQNEAVIPLSRGRAVPVEFSGGGAMTQSQPAAGQSIVFNVTSPNPDSFRRSQTQLATQAYAIGAKATRRNM